MAELFRGHTRINSTLWPKETKRSEGKGIKKDVYPPLGSGRHTVVLKKGAAFL
ncbi:MAG: hypothetical protein HRT71_07830 [Flavobacteriales bacterium]|nr:hypothetical protein [Flavobacteriales bacterium]